MGLNYQIFANYHIRCPCCGYEIKLEGKESDKVKTNWLARIARFIDLEVKYYVKCFNCRKKIIFYDHEKYFEKVEKNRVKDPFAGFTNVVMFGKSIFDFDKPIKI